MAQRISLGLAITFGCVFCACGKDATGPRVSDVPALEPVPAASLGVGKVAFARTGAIKGGGTYATIYIVDTRTGNSSHILDDSVAIGPVLSPDGRRVAYLTSKASASPPSWDIYATTADGSVTERLTSFPPLDGAPAWTPDGAAIVVPVWADGYYNVFSQPTVPNGTSAKQLISFRIVYGADGPQCPGIFVPEVSVSVSPLGELAFPCRGTIYVQSQSGAILPRYTSAAPTTGAGLPFVASPVWSPDGAKLAFVEIRGDSLDKSGLVSLVVRTTNADGTNAKTLVDLPFSKTFLPQQGSTKTWSICWMPDQAHLMFMVPTGVNTGSLWLIASDGQGLTRFTTAADSFDGSVSCSR